MKRCEYSGMFETHVTVAAQDAEGLARFRQVCEALAVKPILIELERGAEPLQPMTATVSQGTLTEARRFARDIAARLNERGFSPNRIKIEAAPENADLPETDAEAGDLPSENYFEYHIKLLLGDDREAEAAGRIAEERGARLSRNAFRQRPDGLQERFVTLRCYSAGRETADRRFHALREALTSAGFSAAKSVCEYCVYDTNAALDEDWLEI